MRHLGITLSRSCRDILNFFLPIFILSSCEVRTEFIGYVKESIPPLWSSGQSSWLKIQRSGFDSRHYQIFWELIGLERGPLSLVGTIEELRGKNSSGCDVDNHECGRRDTSRWPRVTLHPTSCSRSVGIVRLLTKSTEFVICGMSVLQHSVARSRHWSRNVLSSVNKYLAAVYPAFSKPHSSSCGLSACSLGCSLFLSYFNFVPYMFRPNWPSAGVQWFLQRNCYSRSCACACMVVLCCSHVFILRFCWSNCFFFLFLVPLRANIIYIFVCCIQCTLLGAFVCNSGMKRETRLLLVDNQLHKELLTAIWHACFQFSRATFIVISCRPGKYSQAALQVWGILAS
jgi:hypothetical protein